MSTLKLKDKLPFQWKVQTCGAGGCTMVAYIDARQAMDHLDTTVGPDKWQDKYYSVGTDVYCSVGLKIGEEWIWKTDCGTESKIEGEKGRASDAFKRACVKWGLGRFLYSLDFVWIKTFKTAKLDKKGKPIYVPIHDPAKGKCPDFLLKKQDGKPTQFINGFKMDEYVKQVLKK